MNEFVYNVINNAAGAIKKLKLTKNLSDYNAVVIADEHQISYLLCGTLQILKKTVPDMQVSLVVNGQAEDADTLALIQEEWPDFAVYSSFDEYLAAKDAQRSEVMFNFANLRHPMYANMEKRAQKEAEVKRMLDYCTQNPQNLFQLITCIPDIKEALPEVTNAVAEREYEVIYRDYPEDSLEKYVIRLEDIIRSYTDLLPRVQVIRLDRVFGPGISATDDIWVMDVIRDMFTNKKVTVYDRDRHEFASAAYVKDAIIGILVGILSGRKGNIYHVSSWEISRFQIVSHLFDSFPECECAMETENEGWEKERAIEYRMLNARKLRLAHSSNLSKTLYTSKLAALKDTAFWYQNVERYIPKSEINLYYGRMDRIREMELTILNEVDAICKEHNINYFLSAGTMLGAVRHKGFIPWDDDVDIGILPEDYFKFLKVCPQHLSVDYGYQNFGTETTSHYIHDKIRVKNTFFSTKYSNQYPMMNGVYIDVFVYFKTSDKPFLQKFHIWYINVVRRLIGLRWADRPRKHIHYYLSMVALPIMRLFPFLWLHKYYIHVLSWFEKRKTHYRVDSMGFNLKKVGAVPDEWFHGTVEAEFCGRKYPILERYHDFLCHWYGEHYMELLPVSGRKSVHDVVRIDLGQHLFEETAHDEAFRDVDLRGELFETYKNK
ncbi:MAG: LicD family protein [Lachnospiraceae bacterium]|nr:LicD family protein [Lachnospiraceae bacterium]